MRPFALILTVVLLGGAVPQIAQMQTRLQSSDLLKLRSVTAVELSPDGARVAYVVDNNDGPGRPYGQVWVMTFADGKTCASTLLAEVAGTNAPLPGSSTSPT